LKKPTCLVRFRFYKPETEKTEPNRTQTEKNWKKPSQTEKIDPNRFESVVVQKKPNRTKTSQFEPILVQFRFFKKIISV
jgi:hypothetical protein